MMLSGTLLLRFLRTEIIESDGGSGGADQGIQDQEGGEVANEGKLDDDDIMFGGMERMVEAPLTNEAENKATIRVSCEKEMQLYLQTPRLPLCGRDGKFADPLHWWEGMEKHQKFPILSQFSPVFLAIPATLILRR